MRMREFYRKTTNYWQALLYVAIPLVGAYRGTDLLIFLIMRDSHRNLHYLPWTAAATIDTITVFALSTLWWSLMRSGFGRHLQSKNGDVGPVDPNAPTEK